MPSLFSHPTSQATNGKATGHATNQPAYENLFQEPHVPAHRETVD